MIRFFRLALSHPNMLYFLSCSLQLRVVPFSEIEKKQECEVVFFYNSSVPEQASDLENFRSVES